MNLADEILAVNDAQVERVEVPEWGDLGKRVYVRVMTGAERDSWEAHCIGAGEDKIALYKNIRARLVILTACDDQGRLIFKPENEASLTQKSSRALQRLFDVAMRVNKLRKEDIEELTKN